MAMPPLTLFEDRLCGHPQLHGLPRSPGSTIIAESAG
jgi:hypothetical protein